MPQLNPAPWFLIMLMTWMTLLLVMSPKTTTAFPQNFPVSKTQTPKPLTSWNWPWP